jgi:hypothetical protein
MSSPLQKNSMNSRVAERLVGRQKTGGSSLIANSTSPTLTLWLRCAPLA